MVERVIISFEGDEYGIDKEELGIPEDEDVIYKHRFCNETALDLNHIVLKCTCYAPKNHGNCLLKIDH
jgi:hypothetical protein